MKPHEELEQDRHDIELLSHTAESSLTVAKVTTHCWKLASLMREPNLGHCNLLVLPYPAEKEEIIIFVDLFK